MSLWHREMRIKPYHTNILDNIYWTCHCVLFLKIIILKVITFKFYFISIYSNVEFIMEGQIVTEITAKDFNEKKDIMI